MAQDYNETINLPQTDFPMRGNLPKREPQFIKEWEEEKLYHKIDKANSITEYARQHESLQGSSLISTCQQPYTVG